MLSVAWLLVPVVLVGPAAETPPPRADELDALYQRLTGPSKEDRLAAATALTKLPPTGLALYAERLRRARTVPADTFRKLILEIWAQVPDPNYAKTGNLWTMKPEPPWKPQPVKKGEPRPRRPPPHDPEKAEWISALNDLVLDENPVLKDLPERVEARAQAMEAVALLRAIAAAGHAGNPDAVEPLFDFAFDLEGVFRDECGRAIRSMEAQAIPGLIRRNRMQPSKELKGLPLYRMKRYASYQLDRMDRAQPRKAITTAPDDRIRALIIHAYGEARALDAVDAILEQIDAASPRVRAEARWAWLRYVTGPPPPEPPKRKRKLPGGHTESEEKEDYLNYRQMAVLALNRALKDIAGGAPCRSCARLEADGTPSAKADAKKMTDEVFAFHDARRAREFEAQWSAAKKKVAAGDLPGAIKEFSYILAHDPGYAGRAEMAPLFYEYGERLFADEQPEAGAILRQALALDPASPRAQAAEARVLYLDGMARLDAGLPDPEAFRRAAALDPAFEDAHAMAARFRTDGGRKEWVARSSLWAMGLSGAMGLVALLLFVRALRRRRA